NGQVCRSQGWPCWTQIFSLAVKVRLRVRRPVRRKSASAFSATVRPGGARRQVEDPIHFAFTQRLDGRKQSGNSLANPGWRFNKQPLTVGNGSVNGNCHLPLPRPVACERELEALHGLVTEATPVFIGAKPLQIDGRGAAEKIRQLRPSAGLGELGQFPRVQVQ